MKHLECARLLLHMVQNDPSPVLCILKYSINPVLKADFEDSQRIYRIVA